MALSSDPSVLFIPHPGPHSLFMSIFDYQTSLFFLFSLALPGSCRSSHRLDPILCKDRTFTPVSTRMLTKDPSHKSIPVCSSYPSAGLETPMTSPPHQTSPSCARTIEPLRRNQNMRHSHAISSSLEPHQHRHDPRRPGRLPSKMFRRGEPERPVCIHHVTARNEV